MAAEDYRYRLPRRSAPTGASRHVIRIDLAVQEKEGCRDCSWRYWCSGGCTVATFRATGRYDIKSPNCNIYKAIYPEALRLGAEAAREPRLGLLQSP